MVQFEEGNQFKKELKTLTKTYRSLPEDLKVFKKVLEKFPEGNSQNNFILLNTTNNIKSIKARLYSSNTKNKLFRIVYSYFKNQNKITFIELFSKNNKENHNIERLNDFIQLLKKDF